jgi:hypothetical protein
MSRPYFALPANAFKQCFDSQLEIFFATAKASGRPVRAFAKSHVVAVADGRAQDDRTEYQIRLPKIFCYFRSIKPERFDLRQYTPGE